MAASNEWFDYHLTPRGWELGSHKTDCGAPVSIEPPADRVMSIHVAERMSSPFSKLDRTESVSYRTDDQETLERLINRFGDSP